jgi:hypothetical protein
MSMSFSISPFCKSTSSRARIIICIPLFLVFRFILFNQSMSDFLGGHPAKLREALRQYEAAGFENEAAEARALLPETARSFLAVRLAEGDRQRLIEAIFEAEAAGLSEQAAEARAQLPLLVRFLLGLPIFILF